MTRHLASLLSAGLLLVLPADPQVRTSPQTDALGDPLPAGAIARLGTLRLKHKQPGLPAIKALFSPDGSKVASFGGRDICIWDATSGKELRGPWNSLEPQWHCSDIAFSPDSSTLVGVIGSDERPTNRWSIISWDTTNAKTLRAFHYHPPQQEAHSLGFADGGKLLVFASPDGVCWVDAITGKEQRAWHPFGAEHPAGKKQDDDKTTKHCRYLLSPKGNFLLVEVRTSRIVATANSARSVGENEAIVFDMATGKACWSVKRDHDKGHIHCAFSADERLVAIYMGGDKLEVRDTLTGECLKNMPMTDEDRRAAYSGAVALSPDGADGGIRRS